MAIKKNFISKINHWRLDNRHKRQLKSRKYLLTGLGSYATGVSVETEQGFFIVDPCDNFVARALMVKGAYGLKEISLASKFIKTESVCVILGGHIGSIAIPLSKLCSCLHVFEPNPQSFSFLSLNTKLNSCSNIVLHNVAASDQAGTLNFIVHRGNSGASRRRPIFSYEPVTYEQGKDIVVEAMMLDELQLHHSIDLIFMDIEGSEFFALKGAKETLKRTNTLIMEFNAKHFSLVANTSAEELWGLLSMNFDRMINPTSDLQFDGHESILTELIRMIDHEESYDNIIFTKKDCS